MKHNCRTYYLIILMLGALTSCAHATSTSIDPTATGKALTLLFSAANEFIPESSSCHGSYGQQGTATVKDLLSVQMAYLYSGKNIIQGDCTAKQCKVEITHAAGEDVSSAIIKFKIARGRVNTATLQCIITP